MTRVLPWMETQMHELHDLELQDVAGGLNTGADPFKPPPPPPSTGPTFPVPEPGPVLT